MREHKEAMDEEAMGILGNCFTLEKEGIFPES